MDFAGHIHRIFRARGRASTYTAPGAIFPTTLKAIRQGGGQRIILGNIKLSPERTFFNVLRADVPEPVAGAVLEWDDESFTIDAVQPVEKDADGLLWELDCSWGLDVVLRSSIGSGANQSPPQGSNFTVAAAASAGALALWIKSTFTVGKLLAGDTIRIAGDPTTYTVTGAGVAASSNVFNAVPISPALGRDAALGAAVTFDFVRDYTVRAAVAGYTAEEIQGTVQVGDRRLIILQPALDQSSMTDVPKAGDRVTMEGKSFSTVSASAIYQAGGFYAWELQLRSG